MLRVNETFFSIQGEGRYQGHPALFIRLSGCDENCPMCDSKYHIEYDCAPIKEIISKISRTPKNTIIVWTGGEPLIQLNSIIEVIDSLREQYGLSYYKHHLETNGNFISDYNDIKLLRSNFSYVCISPKSLSTAQKINNLNVLDWIHSDIKVVTDLNKLGVDMLSFATMVMPLTTSDKKKNDEIRKNVWAYCVKSNKIFSSRLHVLIWGNERKK